MTAENLVEEVDKQLQAYASMRPRPMTAENVGRPEPLVGDDRAASMRPRPMTAENETYRRETYRHPAALQ